jgi:hypothetical protein
VHDYEIVRHKQDDFATYGRLYDVGHQLICVTLERPWVDANADGHRDRNVSRFAPGEYKAIRYHSPKRGFDVWEFVDIPDIDAAEIHIGNLPEDLEGCVALGTAFGFIQSRRDGKVYPGVTGSKYAFDKFMHDTEGKNEITILVTDAFPERPSSLAA